jgi:hypothetical protein
MHLNRSGQVALQFVDALRSEALKLADGLDATASNLERVAAKSSPEASIWAFTQWQLRKEAKRKGFPRASEMLFTREALEQASHFEVARFHASRFPKGALVADLTTGIGSDLIALAERGPVVGYDVDVVRLECAKHNLAVHGFEAPLHWADCLEAGWDFEYALADPSRRVEGRRTLDPEDFAPNPGLLAEKMSALQLGLMKLSPLLRDDYLGSLGPELDFVSFGRECREALVACGLQAANGRFAWMVATGDRVAAGGSFWTVDEPGAFFYEADPAAIRAHALGSFSIPGLGSSNGYLTSDSELQTPWLTGYRVEEFGRFDLKSVRAMLRELGIGSVVVKSRVPGLDVSRIGKDIYVGGPKDGIMALYPVEKSVRFVLIQRMRAFISGPVLGHVS